MSLTFRTASRASTCTPATVIPCPYALHSPQQYQRPVPQRTINPEPALWPEHCSMRAAAGRVSVMVAGHSRVEFCHCIPDDGEVARQRDVFVVMPHVLRRLVTATEHGRPRAHDLHTACVQRRDCIRLDTLSAIIVPTVQHERWWCSRLVPRCVQLCLSDGRCEAKSLTLLTSGWLQLSMKAT